MSRRFFALGRFRKDLRCVLRLPDCLPFAKASVPYSRFPTVGAVNRFRPETQAFHLSWEVVASCRDRPSRTHWSRGSMKGSDRPGTSAASGTEQGRPGSPGIRPNREAKAAMRDTSPCNSVNCTKG